MAEWLDVAGARALWRDAPADDATLLLYLEAAKAAVIAYAPADPNVTPTEPPLALDGGTP